MTDAGRTAPTDLRRLVEAAEQAGADLLGLTDTVGLLTPRIVTAAVSSLTEWCSHPVSVHLHDDLGAAGGNAIAAAEAGAAQVHTTINGLGPNAGNTALAPLAAAMAVHHGVRVGDLSKLPALSARLATAVGVETPPAAPVVGQNIFRYATLSRAERARAEP